MKQHSPQFLKLAQAAKSRIQEVTPQELKAKIDHKEQLCIVDVREENELSSGRISGAIHLSKGVIERDIEMKIPDLSTPIVVYCSGGFRSALVADSLQTMGYTHVSSLNGGLTAWLAANYPVASG